jgi:hypothetical protein
MELVFIKINKKKNMMGICRVLRHTVTGMSTARNGRLMLMSCPACSG